MRKVEGSGIEIVLEGESKSESIRVKERRYMKTMRGGSIDTVLFSHLGPGSSSPDVPWGRTPWLSDRIWAPGCQVQWK
jgi:hypothetical protein